MSNDKRLNEPTVFTIPPNFAREGTVFNGMFRTRNAIEAALFCGPLAYFMTYIPLSVQYLVILIVLTVGPLAALCLIGINDSPISVYLMDVIKHAASKKKLTYYSFGVSTEIGQE